MTHLLTHVTNTLTSSVTTFETYAFNSVVCFNGVMLGASSNGLSKLDDSASTEVVTGALTTGLMHFGSEMQKRADNFYLGMRSDGDITLRVSTDENTPYEYTIKPYDIDTLKQRRSLIGKGLKGKYWRFELECSDAFDYDTMNIGVAPLSRRL